MVFINPTRVLVEQNNGQPATLPGALNPALFAGGTTSGPPTTGTFPTGAFVIGANADVFVCTAGGTPGSWSRANSANPSPALVLEGPGIDPTGATDSTAALQAKIGTVPAAGGRLFLPVGIYLISATLDLPSNCTLEGCWGGLVNFATTEKNGSLLLWGGAPGGTVLRIFNKSFVIVDGIGVSGGNIDGVTGILVDSSNAPNTRNWALRNVSVFNCGNPATPNGVGIQVGTSAVTNYQVDAGVIERFEVSHCGYGIAVNSANALSISGLRDGSIIGCNKGLFLPSVGPLTVENVAFGGATPGPAPTYIDIAAQNPIVLINLQGEGGTGNFLTVSANPNTAQPLTLLGCTVNRPVDVRVSRRIVSIGNYYSENVTCSGGSSIITSSQDAFDVGKDFVLTSAANQLQRFTPSAVAPFLEDTSNLEGVVHRFRATGSGVNPSIELQNDAAGGGAWQILFPGTTGLRPGGWVLRDRINAKNAISVSSNPLDGALLLNANGAAFNGSNTAGKANVAGSRGGNAALASLLTGLATMGLIVDNTTV